MGHRPSTRRTAGEMLYGEFEPFHNIEGELVSVFTNRDSAELIVNLTLGSILFRADADDDTLYWSHCLRKEEGVDVSLRDPWSMHIGKTFDHAWLTMNQKGYIDGALLSFGGMSPCTALNVMASAIKVSTFGPWRQVSAF
jgi:hypothetical protein